MHRSVLLSLAALTLAPIVVRAQAPDPRLGPRLRLGLAGSPRSARIVGTLVTVGVDTLWLVPDGRQDTLALLADQIRRAEVSTGRGFRTRRAVRGAAVGAAAGALLGVLDSEHQDRAVVAALAATGAVLGFAAEGGGAYAQRGALYGLVVGLPVGALIGASTYEPCQPGAFLCFDESFHVTMGAMGGAALGALGGALVGAAFAGEHWERIAVDAVRFRIAPGPQGVSAAFSYSF